MRLTKAQREANQREREKIAKINAIHVAAGKCRHCGGRVPCWSDFGDQAVGVRHTAKSIAAKRQHDV